MLLKAVAVAVVAAVVVYAVDLLSQYGAFQHYFKHYPGKCSQVKGLDFGSESFRILSNGLTFVTSGFLISPAGPKYKEFLVKNGIKGKIYTVDLSQLQVEASEVKIRPSQHFDLSVFRPHGIDVLEDPTEGHHLVYVVNHPGEGEDRVEKFRYWPESRELEHLQSFVSEQFHLTNDIALTGEDTFYITDYLYFKSRFMHVIEELIGLRLGSVLYFNGTHSTAVATGLCGPNGIVLSEDKRYAYLALPQLRAIYVYEIDSKMGLKLVQEFCVLTSIDNLYLSQDGQSLYAGCHPIGVEILRHMGNPEIKAPSQVIQLPLEDGRIDERGISQTFYDHGDLISASTTASVYKKKLLIGSIIDKLVVCDLP